MERADAIRIVDGALAFQRRTVTPDQRERIISYMIAHDAVAFHAIARVLGTCCHCVDCQKAGGRPRPM